MNQEKTHGATRGQVKRLYSPKDKRTLSEKRGVCNSISLYPAGASFYVQPLTKPQTGGDVGPRGDIKGWSSSSRRRMREYMLTHRPIDGLPLYGVTLTIPGPTMDPARAKEVFASYALSITKAGMGAIWRLEVQKRGMLHWHLIVATRHPADIPLQWWATLKALGAETFDPPHVDTKGRIYTQIDSRMSIVGALEYSCKVDSDCRGGAGSWMRYMQDHNSKGKQEQIAVNVGRHWGVIGRKCFYEVAPDKLHNLTDHQYYRIMRCCQRLATPSHPDLSKPFGRCLGGRVRRGSRGRSIWYSRPETVQRIITWALSLDTVSEAHPVADSGESSALP